MIINKRTSGKEKITNASEVTLVAKEAINKGDTVYTSGSKFDGSMFTLSNLEGGTSISTINQLALSPDGNSRGLLAPRSLGVLCAALVSV